MDGRGVRDERERTELVEAEEGQEQGAPGAGLSAASACIEHRLKGASRILADLLHLDAFRS